MNAILEDIKYLIVHHTSQSYDFPEFIRFRHKIIRGWDDIGYHYVIGNGRLFTKDGKIYQGHPENMEGAHSLGYNLNSLGICMVGDFDRDHPTEQQLHSLVDLLYEKSVQYEISLGNILGHNEIPNVTKSCPGKNVNMNEIRELVSLRLERVV